MTPQVLAINGCMGATDELFDSLETARVATGLRTLSAKHARGLRACWLGLEPGTPEDAASQAALLASHEAPDAAGSCSWQPRPTCLTGAPHPARAGLCV